MRERENIQNSRLANFLFHSQILFQKSTYSNTHTLSIAFPPFKITHLIPTLSLTLVHIISFSHTLLGASRSVYTKSQNGLFKCKTSSSRYFQGGTTTTTSETFVQDFFSQNSAKVNLGRGTNT